MDRNEGIAAILQFVQEHPESYASLAVCRRALGQGVEHVAAQTVEALEAHLRQASDTEIEAYCSIVL